MTLTTLDQKTNRELLKKYGPGNLESKTIGLLRYLDKNCYWRVKTAESYVVDRRDFQVSLQTIADHLGCAVNTVVDHISKAKEKQLVTVNKLPNGRVSFSIHLDPMKNLPTTATAKRQKIKQRRAAQAEYQRAYRKRQQAKLRKLQRELAQIQKQLQSVPQARRT